jgi:hypothetical protein
MFGRCPNQEKTMLIMLPDGTEKAHLAAALEVPEESIRSTMCDGSSTTYEVVDPNGMEHTWRGSFPLIVTFKTYWPLP